MKEYKGKAYNDFKKLLRFLNTNPSNKKILLKFWKMIDKMHGYGYEWLSNSAKRQLDLLIREKNLK